MLRWFKETNVAIAARTEEVKHLLGRHVPILATPPALLRPWCTNDAVTGGTAIYTNLRGMLSKDSFAYTPLKSRNSVFEGDHYGLIVLHTPLRTKIFSEVRGLVLGFRLSYDGCGDLSLKVCEQLRIVPPNIFNYHSLLIVGLRHSEPAIVKSGRDLRRQRSERR
jgi:hypothetical protein